MGGTKNFENEDELKVIVFSGEEGLAAQHPSEDVLNGPDITGLLCIP
jgi:hypothetical protein